MKLEVGKRYLDGEGNVFTLEKNEGFPKFPFKGVLPNGYTRTWTQGGHFYLSRASDKDLKREISSDIKLDPDFIIDAYFAGLTTADLIRIYQESPTEKRLRDFMKQTEYSWGGPLGHTISYEHTINEALPAFQDVVKAFGEVGKKPRKVGMVSELAAGYGAGPRTVVFRNGVLEEGPKAKVQIVDDVDQFYNPEKKYRLENAPGHELHIFKQVEEWVFGAIKLPNGNLVSNKWLASNGQSFRKGKHAEWRLVEDKPGFDPKKKYRLAKGWDFFIYSVKDGQVFGAIKHEDWDRWDAMCWDAKTLKSMSEPFRNLHLVEVK